VGKQGHGQGLIKPERHFRGCKCPENKSDAARDGQEVKEGKNQEGRASAYIGSSNLDRPMNPTSSDGTTFLGDFLSASFPSLPSHLLPRRSNGAVSGIPFEFGMSPEGLIRQNPTVKGFSDPLGVAEKSKNATKFQFLTLGFGFCEVLGRFPSTQPLESSGFNDFGPRSLSNLRTPVCRVYGATGLNDKAQV
jgi:hypothetical protein